MYNWRLLLLAFFAVFLPIASYAERNLVDGRQQCCDHRFARESYSLYGDSRFKTQHRRISDLRREIREVRSDVRSDVSDYRDSYHDNVIRESSEPRSRLSRAELHRDREFRPRARDAVLTPDRAQNFRFTDSDRIRNAESRQTTQIRDLRTDESRIFRARNVDENPDQRNRERLAINSRRETRLMRDNVEIRRTTHARDTREELRRTSDNIIRTDRLSTFHNERVQDESEDRRGSQTRFGVRYQLTVRSQDREINADRKLTLSRDRDEMKNKAEQKNIQLRVRERSSDVETTRLLTKRLVIPRIQRSGRSLGRISRGSNEEKRITVENMTAAKHESESRDVRAQERDKVQNIADRRNIKMSERSEVDSRFSMTRQLDRNQRNVRSLDRLLRDSMDDRRLYENSRAIRDERVNQNVRARERDDVRNVAERRHNEIRERPEVNSRISMTRQLEWNRLSRERMVDRRLSFESARAAHQDTRRDTRDVGISQRDEVRNEDERRDIEFRARERSDVDSRFSTIRNLAQNQRSIRSLDRVSRERNNARTVSFNNLRITRQERENRDASIRSRDVRERERDNIRNYSERRQIEIRVRERELENREIVSRLSQSRRSLSDSSRRYTESRASSRRIDRERTNDESHRTDQRLSRERNNYEQRSVESLIAARSRMDSSRERTAERITNQRNNIRENARDNTRDETLERRSRETSGRRLSRSETRLENSQDNPRERETSENRRTVDERMQNQRRELLRNLERREISPRSNIRNNEIRDKRDNDRASRAVTFERRSTSARIGAEKRNAREVHRRSSEIRDSRYRDNESRFRTKSESRLALIQIERDNVRNVEWKLIQDVDERRKSKRNAIAPPATQRQNIDSRTKSNIYLTRNMNAFNHKTAGNENGAYKNNWQNLIYTLQGIYLCSIFIPLLMKKNSDKKNAKLSLALWTPLQKLIKTD